MNGIVVAICIAPAAGESMQCMEEVEAIAGQGLRGDRYAMGRGSFNQNKQGNRQVTLMNAIFFEGSGFAYTDSRRNFFIKDVELMWFIGREFRIGGARFLGVKYCDPCARPSNLCGKEKSFKETFFDRGGLIAEVIESGIIKIGDPVISPPKGY